MHSESTKVGDLPSNDEKEPEGDCKKKKTKMARIKVHQNVTKWGRGIQFNPANHSINTKNDYRPKKRFRKREKQKKEKQLKGN